MCFVQEAQPNASAHTTVTRRRVNRAKRACLSCRSRKVRCDVTRQSPCSNCKWNTADCIVTESRKSPVRKKRRTEEQQKKGPRQDDSLKNTRVNLDSPRLPTEEHFLAQIQDEDFAALKHLRDSISDTTSPTYQLAQVESPGNYYSEADKAGDAMEWAFLEHPPIGTKTATSFVDSGFHDESCHVLEQSPVAAAATPASSLSIVAEKHEWPDPFVWLPRRRVNEPGDVLLDSLLGMPFDCLRHI